MLMQLSSIQEIEASTDMGSSAKIPHICRRGGSKVIIQHYNTVRNTSCVILGIIENFLTVGARNIWTRDETVFLCVRV